LSNVRGRGEETKPYHTRDKMDIFAHQFAPFRPSASRVQIDDDNTGNDTFGNHQGLCRNDEMNENCCTLGN
jgi:hypothetical protein